MLFTLKKSSVLYFINVLYLLGMGLDKFRKFDIKVRRISFYAKICLFPESDTNSGSVCVTEQHYVSIFFTSLWSMRKPMLF